MIQEKRYDSGTRSLVRAFCLLLVCVLLAGTGYVPAARAATTPVVTLSPGTVNYPNTYTISNLTFSSTVHAGSTTLVVSFDDGNSSMTYIPSTGAISPGLITVNGSAATSASWSSQQVSVVAPTTISANTAFSIVFSATMGITPLTTGSHTISVSYLDETATGSYSVASAGTPVSLDNVSITNPTLNSLSEYRITFTSGVTLVSGSSTISIRFPSGFTVPSMLNEDNFSLQQGSSHVSSFVHNVAVAGNVVTLTIPSMKGGDSYSNFYASIPMTVICGPFAGISNPAAAGTYQFSLWTSLQTTPATKLVVLGTGVTGLSATATPTVGGSIAEYRLSFAVSSTGALAAGTDKVTVAFPAGFTLPSTIPSGAVTVGGTPATAAVSGQNLVVTVPKDVPASQNVSIDITAAAGIRNAAGSASGYQLTVTTSADQLPVSYNLAITPSVVTGASVAVVPGVKGASAAYTFTFTTGLGGALGSGDTITLVLPAGFTVPASIDDRTQVALKSPATATATINLASITCSPSARSIVLTLPSGTTIAGGSTVSISLPAVITNPATGGAFTVKVSTSKETTPVDSASFTIYNNPISTLKVTPVSPDGKSGYYTSQPAFTLAVDGPSGVTLSAFYRIDEAGAFLPYDVKTSPVVKVPEGKHTVSFYAQDSLGNVEASHTQQFLVDLTDPVITVVSPVQGGVVVQSSANVTGKVKALDPAGTVLTVGGIPTPVAADGTFSAVVSFQHEGINPIDIVAASPSGRSTTLTISVNYIARVTMSLVIGSPTVNLNNEFKTLEAAPFISKKGVTMVPLRFISEAFKATVAWDPVFRAVTIDLNGKTLRVQVGFMTADVNGKSFPLQDAPVIVNGRTFVPLRFIAENFGAQVDWNGALRMVSIIYPKP